MAKFIPDIKTQRWVVISARRSARPNPNHNGSGNSVAVDPFGSGNEHLTPPEVWRIGGEGLWNQPGWKVRVVPNKFPITDIHEVVVHSPDANLTLEDMECEHVKLIFQAYRQRYNFHKEHGHVMIFCNNGEQAGASLPHPHSQVVVIPRQINLDELSVEPFNNVISETEHFTVYCPDFSQWPYEVWIAPKRTGVAFGQIEDWEIDDLAPLLQASLRKLKKIYIREKTKHGEQPPDVFNYNFYIHHDTDWYVRIIPRLIHRAGFELGSGLQVNIVDPQDAAEELREIEE